MIEEIKDRMNKKLVNQSVNNYKKSTNWLMNKHIITLILKNELINYEFDQLINLL